MKTLKRIFKEEDGLVAIEYGVIAQFFERF